jgi:uncharacterized protein YdaU (DUF1376 family)
MHYFKFNLKDYAFATRYFDYVHHGAYLQLMSLYYETEKPISLDINVVVKLVMASNEDEVNAIKHILENFFTQTKDGYIQKRCTLEIEAFQKNSELQSIKAKKRWGKIEDDAGGIAAAVPEQSRKDANHKPINNNNKTNTAPPEGVDVLVCKDFKTLRDKKRAPVTDLAIKGLIREAKKANKTLNEALIICIERGWTGFNADWVEKEKSTSASGQRMTDRRTI